MMMMMTITAVGCWRVRVFRSDLCSGPDRQGQDRNERPVRHRASRQVEETHQDRSPGTQPSLAREVLLVSIAYLSQRLFRLELDDRARYQVFLYMYVSRVKSSSL